MPTRFTCPQGHQWEAGVEDPPTTESAFCPQCGALPQSEIRPAAGLSSSVSTLPPRPDQGNAAADEASTLFRPESAAELATVERIRIKGYEILGELGRGGMGVVYQARQVSLKRIVALKMILASKHAGPEDRARFRSEAEAVARLQHPHIVQIHEVGEDDGCPFFSLEFVEGGSLAQKLTHQRLSPREAARLVATLARAVHAAHLRGIIHRDLKPGNVLLTADGQPKITDFGLAKQLETSAEAASAAGRDPACQTGSGVILGTPTYMAPEQAAGKTRSIGPATDTYALGAILYELLTARPPFRAETSLETLKLVASEEPVPPRRVDTKVPRDLETICLKCLEKEPAKRYATAHDLADDLERYLGGEPIVARPLGPAGRLLRWAGRQPALATTLLALVLFYLNHLLIMGGFQVDDEGGFFHWFVTGLTVAWAAGATLFQWLIRWPRWEGPATFGWASMDVVLFTLLLLQGHGPQSSLLAGYLVLVGGAALRFRINLVWYITGLCMVSYLGLVVQASVYRPEIAVKPHVAFIFLIFLGIMGLIFHLILRRVRVPQTPLGGFMPSGAGNSDTRSTVPLR
jgi:hypothetical protein